MRVLTRTFDLTNTRAQRLLLARVAAPCFGRIYEALAAECNLPVLDYNDLALGLREADVVISAMAAPTPVFTEALVAGLRNLHHQFFIDLAVPRSVAARVEAVPGVLVYNIDDIQRKAAAALASRVAAILQVHAIISASLADLRERSREMQLAPTIQKLKSALEQLRQQEISRLPPLNPAEASRVDEITKALTQKFRKLLVLQLKAACQRGDANQLATALTELFALAPGIPTGPPAQPAHRLSLN